MDVDMTFPASTRERILGLIVDGISLRKVCAQDDMPSKSTVMQWLDTDEDFRTKYARAREQQADLMFDEMADVENDVISGAMKPEAARVVLWSRQWRAAKLMPKKYGDKIDLNHSGGLKFERIESVIVDVSSEG